MGQLPGNSCDGFYASATMASETLHQMIVTLDAMTVVVYFYYQCYVVTETIASANQLLNSAQPFVYRATRLFTYLLVLENTSTLPLPELL